MEPTISIGSGWKILEGMTINAYQTQQQVLEEILTQNLHTEYLSQFLNGHSDKEHFKTKVPVVDYEDIKPYMERIANEEPSNIILAETVTALTRSSGTSAGRPKLMPLTDSELDRRTYDQGKRMQLLFVRPEIKAPSGLPTRSILTSYLICKNFEKHESSLHTSPIATILCSDSKQSMYCQMLCALLQRNEVVCVGLVFGSTLSMILNKPNPELADLIEDICNAKSWEGIIKKLCPGTKCIDAIVTGSMAQYIPMLEFDCGGIPLVSKCYASSEGLLGINLKPLSKPCDTCYTLVPNMAYFEFLPVHENNEEERSKKEVIEVVDLVNVKLGQCYELVVTTFIGLYRYKVGDILKVTGYHNNAPQFQFVRRKDAFLSIDSEKTAEDELAEGILQAKLFVGQFQLQLVDYTSAVDISLIPGHYILFWELKMEESSKSPELRPSIIEECCYIVEQSLNFVYRASRMGNSIGPLEIRVVKHGTFDALMEFSVSKGFSVSQYNTPRCIKLEEALKILNSRVVGRYFSQQLPGYKILKWKLNKSM
ncbi:hypothetical protein ES288_A04G137300v1 [Gossypium darwinii]|nr:hypothetical protein ES288_A04G137300v1 [Gossypium darwinii]